MPTTYAHNKFCREVLARLPEREKRIVRSFRPLYELGADGPDVFFFYLPAIYKNRVNRIGYDMHRRPGREFFLSAAERAKTNGFRGEELAFLFGFLTHFVLDSYCHGYVYEKDAEGVASHNEIEGELDRALMVKDGLNPLKFYPGDRMETTWHNADIISRYFPLSTAQAHICLHSCRRDRRFAVQGPGMKRRILFRLMKMFNLYDWMHGVILNLKPADSCRETTEYLMKRMEEAVPVAVSLISEFIDCAEGRRVWSNAYDNDFCGNFFRHRESIGRRVSHDSS